MKNILILLIFAFGIELNAQAFIQNINSKNSFDIMVFLNGRLIHSHIMVPGDILKIETHGEILELRYKRLTDICDCEKDTPEFDKFNSSVDGMYAPDIRKKGTWNSVRTNTPNNKPNAPIIYQRFFTIPKHICPRA